jgi:tetratricopeptide (TPR) repeat protein
LNRGWAPLRGLLRGGRKNIALPLPEVYDLPKDPGEVRNLFDEQRAEARQAFAALPKESAWPPARGAVSAAEESRLRSLGYLSGSAAAKASYGPEDDPKRLVGLDRKIHQMIDLYSRGRVDEAVKVGQGVVQERPAMPLGHSLLAQALLQAGRTAEALEVMQKARAQGVSTDALSRQLGLTLAEIGRAKDAITVLQPLADAGDIRARNALALALSEAGRQEDAQALLRKVLQEDPDNAKAYEQLGLTELRLGRWAPARDDSRRAVELSPSAALAWNNLGVALYQLGERGDALDAWQRAVDLKRDLWDALWNLGTKALELGRTQQGRAALERFVAGAPEKQYGNDVRQARSVLAQLGAGSR